MPQKLLGIFIKDGQITRTIQADKCWIENTAYNYIADCRVNGDRIIYSIPIEGTDYTMEWVRK